MERSGSELSAETKKRIVELRKQLETKPALTCAICGINIHEAITGKYDTEVGALCKLCFSKQFGEEIERHPIRSAPLEKTA